MEKKSNYLNIFSHFILIILLFSVVFDPQNSHFHVKTLSFFIFFIISLRKLNGKYIIVPIIVFALYFTSYSYGILTNTRIDEGVAKWYLNSFLFLLLVLFVPNKSLKFLKTLYNITLLLSIYIVFLTINIFIQTPIQNLVTEHIKNNSDFVMFGFRQALGLPYFCLYYRTSCIVVISQACSLLLFAKSGKKIYLLHSVLFFLELFLSGARANMFSALFIVISFIIAYNFYEKKRVIFFISFCVIFLFVAGILLFRLITESGNSNDIKMGHMSSFIALFSKQPMKYLLIGSGPGSFMYSMGRNQEIALTELSYFELIKSFGLIPTCFILFSFLYPVIKLWSNTKNKKIVNITITVAYLCFFLIAGTNPLFFGSTGFTIVICMFYLCDKDIYLEFEILYSNNRKTNCFKSFTQNYLIR